MEVRLPILVQDRMTSTRKESKPFEFFHLKGESFFLDGPVGERVAVLDFDEKGHIVKGAAFQAPKKPGAEGSYAGRLALNTENMLQRELNQVSVFAAVMKTIKLFEDKRSLGRRVGWAFDAPQLLVVPRAGRWANAFYERNTHSLQFFYFENPHQPGDWVYTSLSLDIVSHETAHAILDGIVPSLYDAITPQALALHEAIADLVAVIVAMDSRNLTESVLAQTGGSIRCSTAFSSLAEEFGSALDQTSRVGYLRDLLNEKNLDPNDRVNGVTSQEPHELSQVLSGALYKLMVELHEKLKADARLDSPAASEYSLSGKALKVAWDRFRRLLLRALDYLPVGDVTFADYGRAIIAADQASYPTHPYERECVRDEFVRRKIVPGPQALQVETNYAHPALDGLNLEDLRDSEWIAYRFAENQRPFLHIPPKASFKVEPRLDVTKLNTHTQQDDSQTRELIFKVSWTDTEPNSLGGQFPPQRRLKLGTTLVIDWNTRQVRALLTSGQNIDLGEKAQQSQERDLFLRDLVLRGYLVPERQALGPDGQELQNVVGAAEVNGAMRVRDMARMLHIIDDRAAGARG